MYAILTKLLSNGTKRGKHNDTGLSFRNRAKRNLVNQGLAVQFSTYLKLHRSGETLLKSQIGK